MINNPSLQQEVTIESESNKISFILEDYFPSINLSLNYNFELSYKVFDSIL